MRGVIPALARRLPPLPPFRDAAPLALLLLALSSVFVFGNDRSQFYREVDDDVSAETLTLAANLSAEHGFLGFRRQWLDEDGERRYVAYNRFPIGNYALVKLAILPFGDDFPRAIRSARLLMLAFFAAAAVLAHLALARLLGDRRIALAATLLAFSSYYLLHYSDSITAETSTNLFGVMLAFHGMAVFAQERRFRQLLVKTAVAVLLGWHVVGLIAPFVLLGLASEARRARGGGGARLEVRRALGALARSRYLACGAFAVLCCALLLGFNLGNEYRALGGEVALTELPSFESILRRSDVEPRGPGWGDFLQTQLGRIGGAAIPYAAVDRLGLAPSLHALPPPLPYAVAGAAVAVLAACAAAWRRTPHRALFAALLLTGWCWAILFRGNAAMRFEAMFHAGIPLVFWSLVLLGLRRLSGRQRAARVLPAAALAAGAAFALSAALMGSGQGEAEAALQRGTTADFRAMRPFTTGRSVLFDPAALAQVSPLKYVLYWLYGSYLRPSEIGVAEEWDAAARRDYVILPVDIGGSLTPGNGRFHLYSPATLGAAWDALAAREPDARSAFEVRLDGRAIVWTRDGCAGEDVWPPLFVHAVPLDADDLLPDRREAGFEAIGYFLPHHGARFGGRCVARAELPGYPLAGVRTGQRQGSLPPVWEVSFPVGDPSFPRRAATWFGNVTADEPAVGGPFAAYLDGHTLTYVRDGCAWTDAEARFFVHAYAADAGDLPAERREAGFESLDFWFADRGVRFGGTCMAQIALPDYALRSVRTGQYDDTGHLWDAEFAPGAEAWLARFEALDAREPDARGAGFTLRLDGRTLTLAREGCSAADVAARFFVHAYAADGSRENLDFWFRQRGLRHGDRCMASVGLPPSAARVVAGQYDASGHLWEAALAVGE